MQPTRGILADSAPGLDSPEHAKTGLDAGAHALSQPVLLLVDALQAFANRAVKYGYGALDDLLIDLAPGHGETIACRLPQMPAGCFDAGQQLLAGTNNKLGGRGWRWGTEIGDEMVTITRPRP